MSQLNRYLIVFDFETDGINTETTNIVQIGAIPIDMRNLTILTDDAFNIDVQPADLGKPEYVEANLKTIEWHAGKQNTDVEGVLTRWKNGLAPSDGLKSFLDYCKQFSTGKSYDKIPASGGYNIAGFDIPILDRYCKQYGRKYPFHRRDSFDLLDMVRHWFLFSQNPPKDYRLDTIRERLGMSSDKAHDALFDVQQEAELLVKFLTLFKTFTKHVEVLR